MRKLIVMFIAAGCRSRDWAPTLTLTVSSEDGSVIERPTGTYSVDGGYEFPCRLGDFGVLFCGEYRSDIGEVRATVDAHGFEPTVVSYQVVDDDSSDDVPRAEAITDSVVLTPAPCSPIPSLVRARVVRDELPVDPEVIGFTLDGTAVQPCRREDVGVYYCAEDVDAGQIGVRAWSGAEERVVTHRVEIADCPSMVDFDLMFGLVPP